jgi:enoyl-[acyl-carrier-protein] reductase (NADH)
MPPLVMGHEYWNTNIPAGRLIEIDEIAACCIFLLSDASSALTGANIVADLGMTSLLVSGGTISFPRPRRILSWSGKKKICR